MDIVYKRFENLLKNGDLPHILIHGPKGSGKSQMVKFILAEIYGSDVGIIRTEKKMFETSSSRTIVELDISSSKFHLEVSPGVCGEHDVYVLQTIIKEIAQASSLTGNMLDSHVKYRVIVIRGADNVSKQAQSALRMTMEKYTISCRLILVCEKHNKIIKPIRSRCLDIRVPYIGSKKIVVEKDWETFIDCLASKIIIEQSPRTILVSRDMVHELLSSGVPGCVVLEKIVKTLTDKVDGDELRWEITKWGSYYENILHNGNRDIVHIEAFLAKFMYVYKENLVNEF